VFGVGVGEVVFAFVGSQGLDSEEGIDRGRWEFLEVQEGFGQGKVVGLVVLPEVGECVV
jgi:hypothetical protein